MSPNNLDDRNIEIAERLIKEESTLVEVGREYDLTKERVRQIFLKIIRKCRHASHLEGVTIPKHDYHNLIEIRKHKEFWLNQIEKLRIEINSEHNTNDPVRFDDNFFYIPKREALKKAFHMFNKGRPPQGYENFQPPAVFPCFVKIEYSDRGKDYLKFSSISMSNVEKLMQSELN